MTVPVEQQTSRQLLITIIRNQDLIVTNQQITLSLLGEIDRKATTIMSDQSHLDADVATLQGQVTALNAAAANIQAEIAALKAANPAVDFTGLDAAVAAMTGATTAVQADESQPPAPPAPPA